MAIGTQEDPSGARQGGVNAEDERLWTAFQGLVDAHGRTGSARVLGVNYRTVVANLDAGRLSRRMRNALRAYQESEAEPPEEMASRVALPEKAREGTERGGPTVEESVGREWRPRVPGSPDASVVTLEPRPDEKVAFGLAAELVAEWRGLRTGGSLLGNNVNRARAEERRWEIEVLLVEEHGLTLPPEREPLQGSRRSGHLRRLREALEHARRQRVTAERWARLRMVLTLGLWRSG